MTFCGLRRSSGHFGTADRPQAVDRHCWRERELRDLFGPNTEEKMRDASLSGAHQNRATIARHHRSSLADIISSPHLLNATRRFPCFVTAANFSAWQFSLLHFSPLSLRLHRKLTSTTRRQSWEKFLSPRPANLGCRRISIAAVALLHSFTYMPANDAFRDVAQKDPTCAMAYWGMAMANFHQLWQPPLPPASSPARAAAQHAIAEAQKIGAPTERERGFIHAAQVILADEATAP